MDRLGRHIIIDGQHARCALLNDRERLVEILQGACTRAGARVLDYCIHQFTPQGVTVLMLLAESHASIHTWPERAAYCADVFTCGGVDPSKIAEELYVALGGKVQVRVLERG